LTIPRKLFAFLKALPTILGCIVFLFSIILPFCYIDNFPAFSTGGPFWTYIWSFKAVDYHAMVGLHVIPYWFFNYWFSENWVSLAVPWIPLTIFAVQVLVLAFGITSIHFKRRVMLAATVCLSVAVIALMLYIGKILPYRDSSEEYQLGYYLVFPSLALFLSAFILNEATKKQQTPDSRLRIDDY
jgi:hypothetical protein